MADAVKEYEEEEEMPYVTSCEQIGIKKGRKEGREEGVQEGLLTAIELGLQFKFGEEGLALMPLLTPITGIDWLQQFYLHMLAGADVEELRAVCGGL